MGDSRRAAHWPLTAAAVLFLAACAWPILAPDLAQPWPEVCRLAAWGTWGLLVVDYMARLALSRSRWLFVRRNLLDLAVVALPLLRPRLAKVLRDRILARVTHVRETLVAERGPRHLNVDVLLGRARP